MNWTKHRWIATALVALGCTFIPLLASASGSGVSCTVDVQIACSDFCFPPFRGTVAASERVSKWGPGEPCPEVGSQIHTNSKDLSFGAIDGSVLRFTYRKWSYEHREEWELHRASRVKPLGLAFIALAVLLVAALTRSLQRKKRRVGPRA